MDKKNANPASDRNRGGIEALERVLTECVRKQASALHLSTGRVPYLRRLLATQKISSATAAMAALKRSVQTSA